MEIDDFILDLYPPNVREIVQHTHQLIYTLIPSIQSSIKWKIPFYHYHKNLCYINPQEDSVILGFVYGSKLSNIHGILEGSGKQVRHITLYQLKDIYEEGVSETILEAVLHNEQFISRSL